MDFFGDPLLKLIDELGKLPGIGKRGAQRIAFHIIDLPLERVAELSEAILNAKNKIKYCGQCQTISDKDPCAICGNPSRDRSLIMVVETPRDMMAYEKTREFRGLYHVLHGSLSPIKGIAPDGLTIKQLLQRLKNAEEGEAKEIILATNSNVEGEATAMYIGRLLKPLGIAVTRIAAGVPVGADIEYIDEVTLARALSGRAPI
jgi:recombination protein RecR